MKSLFKIFLLPILCLALLCGCSAEPKTFSKDGVSITLTSQFEELEQEGCVAVYGSRSEAVMIQKEDFSALAEIGINADSTPLDYANAVIKANELSESTAEERDGMVCFTYTAKSGLKTYSYLATVHKSEDAFWLIQFSSSDKKFEEKEPTFLSYAKSIVLS